MFCLLKRTVSFLAYVLFTQKNRLILAYVMFTQKHRLIFSICFVYSKAPSHFQHMFCSLKRTGSFLANVLFTQKHCLIFSIGIRKYFYRLLKRPGVKKLEHMKVRKHSPGLKVIKLEYSLKLNIKRSDWLPRGLISLKLLNRSMSTKAYYLNIFSFTI